jgi:putative tryptophan/tyrosine transport system substrate-binding protein
MKRRAFIAGLTSAAATSPLAARAQQTLPTVGFLSTASPLTAADELLAFRQGLSEMGWTDGTNVALLFAWAEGNFERLPGLAADLVGRRPSVIFAGSVAARFAKNATATIPIVFTSANDPVDEGLVASISRPSGNITGVSLYFGELGAKRFELLQELVPTSRTVALLINPNNPSTESYVANVQQALPAFRGKELRVLTASTDAGLRLAFSAMLQPRVDALLIAPDPYFGRNRLIVELSNRHGIPAVFTTGRQVAEGGLVSYGTNLKEGYRQAGLYAGRILKGEKPSDLPVLQPTKFELVINIKTAKALGVTVPPKLLFTADEVIE